MRVELTDHIPYGFPFVAMLRGTEADRRRVDTPVIVQGYFGLERHYFHVQLPNKNYTVTNDSMLYVET